MTSPHEQIFGPLRSLHNANPGWVELQQAATSPAPSAEAGRVKPMTAVLSAIKGVKPVTATTVRERLEAHDLPNQEVLHRAIANTVGFARNTIEAQRIAHDRAGTLGYFRTDMTESGPHMAVRSRADREKQAAKALASKADQLNEIREELPFKGSHMLALRPAEQPLFLGFAELFGMARASFKPTDLEEYLVTCDVRGTNTRTETLLRNSGQIIGVLSGEQGPVEILAGIGVNMPEAMTIATLQPGEYSSERLCASSMRINKFENLTSHRVSHSLALNEKKELRQF